MRFCSSPFLSLPLFQTHAHAQHVKARPGPPLIFPQRTSDDGTRRRGRSVTVSGADDSVYWIRFSGAASARCVCRCIALPSTLKTTNSSSCSCSYLQFLSAFYRFHSSPFFFPLWQFHLSYVFEIYYCLFLKNMQIKGKFTVNNLFFLLFLPSDSYSCSPYRVLFTYTS